MSINLEEWKAVTASAFSDSAQQALLLREGRREFARELLELIQLSQQEQWSPGVIMTNVIQARLRRELVNDSRY